jgi:hypothetical protein
MKIYTPPPADIPPAGKNAAGLNNEDNPAVMLTCTGNDGGAPYHS